MRIAILRRGGGLLPPRHTCHDLTYACGARVPANRSLQHRHSCRGRVRVTLNGAAAGSSPGQSVMPGKGNDSGLSFGYGTAALGRLKYRTADEARGAADDLGADGVHSHTMDTDGDGESERFFMPAEDHDTLNDSLEEQGLPPKPSMQAMGSDAADPMQMSSDGMNEMMPSSKNSMSADGETMAGDRPDEASMFSLFGDSDDDGEMEIY